jgi:lipid-binding SYLF domain-containing protein
MKTLKSITLLMALLFTFTTLSMAEDSKREINRDADKTLKKFYKEVSGSKRYLERAKGYVVFTDIKEAGFFIGGRYGEGVLRVGGVSKAYYSITSASIGMQMGAQEYSLVIAFTTNAALNKFITDDDWDTDIDVNMAIVDWNAEEEADDIDFGTGAIGFILDSKGMMGNFTFEGTEFDRITPKD